MEKVDLVLIEGFKSNHHPKLEVYRSVVGKNLMASDDNTIVAVASDKALAIEGTACLDLNEIPAIADYIIANCGIQRQVNNGTA